MMEWAIAQRASVFDFGRSSIGAGTAVQEQWGAVGRPLHTMRLLSRKTLRIREPVGKDAAGDQALDEATGPDRHARRVAGKPPSRVDRITSGWW